MNVTPTREQIEAGQGPSLIAASLERITGKPPISGMGYVHIPDAKPSIEGYVPVACAFDGTISYTDKGEYDTLRFRAVLHKLDEPQAKRLADFARRLYTGEDPALDLLEELLSMTERYKAHLDSGDRRQWDRISAKTADLRSGIIDGDDADHV